MVLLLLWLLQLLFPVLGAFLRSGSSNSVATVAATASKALAGTGKQPQVNLFLLYKSDEGR